MKTSILPWALAATLLASSLAAYAAEKVVAPTWLRRPHAEDLMAVWPKGALKRGVSGRAVIRCKVNTSGVLFDCETVSERPAGKGFGAAAIGMTPQLLMKPATAGGQAVVYEWVTLPVTFDAGDPQTGSRLGGANTLSPIEGRVLRDLTWIEAPTYQEVAAAYPEKARAAALGGRVSLTCNLRTDGHIFGCSTLAEEPKGQGFANAAKTLAGSFAVEPSPGLKGRETHIAVTFDPRILAETQPFVGTPQWTAMPEPEEIRGGYPKAASQAKVAKARVVVACVVDGGGALSACTAASEDPPGLGFGPAALVIAPSFQMSLWTDEGLPVIGGHIRLPIRYEAPDTGAAK